MMAQAKEAALDEKRERLRRFFGDTQFRGAQEERIDARGCRVIPCFEFTCILRRSGRTIYIPSIYSIMVAGEGFEPTTDRL